MTTSHSPWMMRKSHVCSTNLGKLYTADLSDNHMAASVTSQLLYGLKRVNQSFLPGKHNVWCYQFTLYQCLMWPLKLCDITSTTVLKMDSKANSYIRKWLGLPRCLSNMALFWKTHPETTTEIHQLGLQRGGEARVRAEKLT